jgi:cold shock CspA family protein
MAKSQQTWNKKDREQKKQKKRKAKEQKKEERKANSISGDSDDMIAYVDEFGNLTSTPPDPAKKSKVSAENIAISVPKREALEVTDVVRKGIVTYFNGSKGYGFIRDDETQESIFTHINEHIDSIKENDRVTFEIEKGQKGLNAVRVKLSV